jgi:hypothetical protein
MEAASKSQMPPQQGSSQLSQYLGTTARELNSTLINAPDVLPFFSHPGQDLGSTIVLFASLGAEHEQAAATKTPRFQLVAAEQEVRWLSRRGYKSVMELSYACSDFHPFIWTASQDELDHIDRVRVVSESSSRIPLIVSVKF